MTRINVIPPKFLTDEWLLAEHRELKRIPNKILSGVAKTFSGVPKYTLGKGHEIFFRNKLTYLRLRYDAIHKECLKRGFNVQDYTFYISQFSVEQTEKLWNNWEPDDDAIIENLSRLCERFDDRKKAYHFHGAVINDDHTFNRYIGIMQRRTNKQHTEVSVDLKDALNRIADCSARTNDEFLAMLRVSAPSSEGRLAGPSRMFGKNLSHQQLLRYEDE